MSLLTIKDAAFDLLQRTPGGNDLTTMLALLNQCRLDACRRHDWLATEATGYLAVAATTGSLLSETKASYTVGVGPSGDALDVKMLRFARTYDTTNSVWVPAELMRQDVYESFVVRSTRQVPEGYPSGVASINSTWEEPFSAYDTRNLLLIDGLTLNSLRAVSVDVKLWCQAWLTAYDDFDADDDFLIVQGADYMMWYAVAAFNHKTGTFVPRNEGSIDPGSPAGMRDAAWDSLLIWDAYQRQQTTYIGAMS